MLPPALPFTGKLGGSHQPHFKNLTMAAERYKAHHKGKVLTLQMAMISYVNLKGAI